MTDEEKQLLKTGTEAAFKPFANLIERLFGGAVDQIGGMWEDRLKVRREVRKLRLMKQLKEHIEEIGFEPQPIPDKIWLPAVQSVLNEDDVTLQQMWADLLGNAANPSLDELPPAFPEVLRQLSPADARFLKAIAQHNRDLRVRTPTDHLRGEQMYALWDAANGHPAETSPASEAELIAQEGPRRLRFLLSLDNLTRLGLIKQTSNLEIKAPDPRDRFRQNLGHTQQTMYLISTFGERFIAACTRPAPASQDQA